MSGRHLIHHHGRNKENNRVMEKRGKKNDTANFTRLELSQSYDSSMARLLIQSGCIFPGCYFGRAGINEFHAQRSHLSPFCRFPPNLSLPSTLKVELPRSGPTGFSPSHNPPPRTRRCHSPLCRCFNHCTPTNR